METVNIEGEVFFGPVGSEEKRILRQRRKERRMTVDFFKLYCESPAAKRHKTKQESRLENDTKNFDSASRPKPNDNDDREIAEMNIVGMQIDGQPVEQQIEGQQIGTKIEETESIQIPKERIQQPKIVQASRKGKYFEPRMFSVVEATVKVQSVWRGFKQRRIFIQTISFVRQLQKHIRVYLNAQRDIREKKKLLLSEITFKFKADVVYRVLRGYISRFRTKKMKVLINNDLKKEVEIGLDVCLERNLENEVEKECMVEHVVGNDSESDSESDSENDSENDSKNKSESDSESDSEDDLEGEMKNELEKGLENISGNDSENDAEERMENGSRSDLENNPENSLEIALEKDLEDESDEDLENESKFSNQTNESDSEPQRTEFYPTKTESILSLDPKTLKIITEKNTTENRKSFNKIRTKTIIIHEPRPESPAVIKYGGHRPDILAEFSERTGEWARKLEFEGKEEFKGTRKSCLKKSVESVTSELVPEEVCVQKVIYKPKTKKRKLKNRGKAKRLK